MNAYDLLVRNGAVAINTSASRPSSKSIGGSIIHHGPSTVLFYRKYDAADSRFCILDLWKINMAAFVPPCMLTPD